ncbi:DUF397 domain-containing protein [Actinocrispum wychmicini]|uniref:Uncharacterized protein DUF397 n=1 Tax=Actinocrispum wychmicini TaxID=1213861 RepID=A0A4R2IRI1_9PSEU|nr:DUF397 domain-containing protein [Actinocrispum wychmicini]TCO47991.1 uncharacterized protein DUF397 [Actinocrispum wychmicini]
MTVPHRTDAWRKSSFSPQGSDCVEVHGSLHAVRDSKNPSVELTGVNLRALVSALRHS